MIPVKPAKLAFTLTHQGSCAQDLMSVAGKALKANIMTLGPLVLPLSEQLRFAANWLARRGLGMKLAPYLPNFTCVAFLPASAKSPNLLL